MKTVEVDCPQCGGDGKETCDNPDHGFIAMMPGDIGRIGCPCCGHDENHKVPNGGKCEHCNGTGIVLYVLASEAEADIVSLKKQYADSCSESDSMLPEIKELRTQLTAANERIAELERLLQAHQTRANTPTKRMDK